MRIPAVRLVLLVGVCACSDPRLVVAPPILTAAPAVLRFENAFIGHPAVATFEVRNGGRAPDAVTFTTELPFILVGEGRPLLLEGGASARVEVRFEPGTAGLFEGAVSVLGTTDSLTLPLSGSASHPPDCTSDDPCTETAFDGTRCMRRPVPDGTACDAGLCIDDGRCVGGSCAGVGVICPDDGNACTADVCEPTRGCLHLDTSSSCPIPDDPCQVPTCEPEVGCTWNEAPDGTACGPRRCPASGVCSGGSCLAPEDCAPAPFLRALASAPGQHTPRALAPLEGGGWFVTGDDGLHPNLSNATPPWLARIEPDGSLAWLLHYPGLGGPWGELVADGAGGAFLLGGSIARVDGDGRLRWVREVEPAWQPWLAPALLDRAGRLVFATGTRERAVQLVRLDADGNLVDARHHPAPAALRGRPVAMVEFGSGYAVLADQILKKREEVASWLLVVGADGAPRWSRILRGATDTPVGFSALAPLGDGLLVIGGSGNGDYGATDEATLLLHLGPDGQVRWSRSVPGRPAVRAFAVSWPTGSITLVGEAWGSRDDETIGLLDLDAAGTPERLVRFALAAPANRFAQVGLRTWGAAANGGSLGLLLNDVGWGGFMPFLLQLGSNGEGPPDLPAEIQGVTFVDATVIVESHAVEDAGLTATARERPIIEPVPVPRFTLNPLDSGQRVLAVRDLFRLS